MTTEEQRFPVGMRVLVVDDDATCLKLMETLLKQCQYHVTTTTRAREALRMLKEDRKRFDIVITDVEMPDMDGIKLLQLVGLEMDLPVIMLSAYSDPKNVMKGIKNGACDFLLKPVRIQELQNIWQHVVRKNKSLMLPTPPSAADEGGKTAPTPTDNPADQQRRLDEKNVEDNTGNDAGDDEYDEDDEDEGEEFGGNDCKNEEPTAKKKTRLFWSVELHQKFVDAVNQLGQDKAFPKKILDLMNVEGLTREKVASHLQKYRLYLKKMKAGPSQGQATNKVGGIGGEAAHIRSLGLGGGYGVFRSLAGSATFSGATSTFSHQPSGMLVGRLNTASGLSMSGLSSSAMLQRCQFPISNTPFTTPSKFEPATATLTASLPTNLNNNSATAGLFQGIPTTTSTLYHNKASLLYPSATSSLFNGNPHEIIRGFGNQSSLTVGPSFQQVVSAAPSQNPFPTSVPAPSFQHNVFSSIGNPQDTSPHHIQDDLLDLFCGISSLENSKGNPQSQDDLTTINSFSNVSQPQSWQNHRPDYVLNSCNLPSGSSSLITATTAFNQPLSQSNNMAPSPLGEIEGITSHLMQQNQLQESNVGSSLRFNENYLLDDPKLFKGSRQNSSEYLEDVVGRFLKQGNSEAEEIEDFELDPSHI